MIGKYFGLSSGGSLYIFVALAFQTLGSAPAISAVIANAAARYYIRLGLAGQDIFFVVMNLPEPMPENNIGALTTRSPGAHTRIWPKNPFGGDNFACVIQGEAGNFFG